MTGVSIPLIQVRLLSIITRNLNSVGIKLQYDLNIGLFQTGNTMVRSQENLGNHVIKMWDDEKGYFVVTLPESSRKTVDIYIEGNLDLFRQWDNSKPIYTIQDVSGGNVVLTPYLKERLGELNQWVSNHELEAYVAIVMEESFTGHVMRTFGRLLTMSSKRLHQMFFTDIKQAEKWIVEQQNK